MKLQEDSVRRLTAHAASTQDLIQVAVPGLEVSDHLRTILWDVFLRLHGGDHGPHCQARLLQQVPDALASLSPLPSQR